MTPVDYERAADAMRADARAFLAISVSIEPLPHYATFGPTLANRMRDTYEQLAHYCLEAARQADELAALPAEALPCA